VPVEETSGGTSRVHLVINGQVLHPGGGKDPNPWPWGKPTVRVPAQEFIDNPCRNCLKGLNEGLKA